MSTIPNLIEPPLGRPSLNAGQLLLPPWPWTLRRVGEEPEDWASESLSTYYGLEFPGSTEYPPNEICDFLVPSNWVLEGTTAAGGFTYAGYSYTYPSAVIGPTDPPVKLGGRNYGSATEEWDSLASVYELQAHAVRLYGDSEAIVSIYESATSTATSAGQPDLTVDHEFYATVYLPECCKNEVGDVVWRMKIYVTCLSVHYDIPVNDVLATHIGVDFVDADYPSYSKDIDAPSGAFTATLTVEREPYTA